MFGIFHVYETDGGIGDAIYGEDLLYIVDDETVAKEYCERFSNEHVYDRPYAELHCGLLEYREIEDNFDPEKRPTGWGFDSD